MNKLVKIFKHTFIPHEHNNYKPHFFREASIISLTVVAVTLLVISAGTVRYMTNGGAAVLPAVLVDLTNNARTASNEQTLTRNLILDIAAQLKADDMASAGYFSHTSPTGVTPWHWFDKAGYYFSYAGENLAINFTESSDVETAWLNSPTHKANIMNANFTEIGIATVDGMYQGHPTTYVVQMFGKPAFKPLEVPKAKVTPTVKKDKTTLTKVKKPTAVTTLALAPTVKGESVTPSDKLVTIESTKEFVSVKNTEVAGDSTQVAEVTPKYSSWTDRFAFLAPSYVDRIYRVFIWLVLASLVGMIIIEVKRQHPKNILYGMLILIIMFSFMYINQHAFISSFVS